MSNQQVISKTALARLKTLIMKNDTPRHERLKAAREEALESLLRSENRYRTVFENTGTGTFVKERDMTISMVNSGFEHLTGYSKKEVEGRMKWTDFFVPEDHARLIKHHADRRGKRQAPDELECKVLDKFGNIKNVYLKLAIIPDTQKSIGSLMDITQLKKAEDEVHEGKIMFSAIVEGFEGLLYVRSQDFRLQYLNSKLIIRLGRDVTGEICYKALYGRKSICPFCVWSQVKEGETVRFEIKDPIDGRWYDSVNTPLAHIDGSLSMIAMVTDINDRKVAEASLRKAEVTLRKENLMLRSSIKDRHKFGNIVGKSAAMQQVYEQIVNAAATDANVVIYGEPGTGKELVAYAIHDMSQRREKRFVPVHCGAIPENLYESEFFGYTKGAFSGANLDRQGYVDFADNGTLFLDEVGEINLNMQVKLLRVLEGGGYTPVGSNQQKIPDIRIIAATNRDLKDRVKNKLMRDDFFYRIHIFPIFLPPLRDRKDDLPLLVDHFLMLHGCKQNLPPITGKMYETLYNHNWPGNIRELQSVIIRYCSLKRIDLMNPTIQSTDFGRMPDACEDCGSESINLRGQMEKYEKQLIQEMLNEYQWHRTKVAKRLGVDRKTLFSKMKRYGLLGSIE